MFKKKLIIAIDGPAGSGKSTVTKKVAGRLGYLYLDTGAMYRAVTLKAMDSGVDLKKPRALSVMAGGTKIVLRGKKVFLDGKDVTGRIRSPEVSRNTHFVSVAPGVRAWMKARQREIGRNGGIVAEGRDIGTVVFPEADRKFYLDASPAERARRRHRELAAKGYRESLKKVLSDTAARDRNDSTRKIAPLKKAKDAVLIDTTGLTIREVTDKILRAIQ